MQPEAVAAVGYEALRRGKQTAVAGLYNKLLVLSAKWLPASVTNPIAQWMVNI